MEEATCSTLGAFDRGPAVDVRAMVSKPCSHTGSPRATRAHPTLLIQPSHRARPSHRPPAFAPGRSAAARVEHGDAAPRIVVALASTGREAFPRGDGFEAVGVAIPGPGTRGDPVPIPGRSVVATVRGRPNHSNPPLPHLPAPAPPMLHVPTPALGAEARHEGEDRAARAMGLLPCGVREDQISRKPSGGRVAHVPVERGRRHTRGERLSIASCRQQRSRLPGTCQVGPRGVRRDRRAA